MRKSKFPSEITPAVRVSFLSFVQSKLHQLPDGRLLAINQQMMLNNPN